MTTILAADTATTACSVALLHEGRSIQHCDMTPRSHTKTLLPMIDSLLSDAAISLTQVDAIAFTNGPGSFTGIRIGFGVIQGLALGAEKPVIPVSTLALLAATATRKLQVTGSALVLPALDARMGEVYWSLFHYGNKSLRLVVDDALSCPEDVFSNENTTPSAPLIGVGDGWQFADRITVQPEQIHPDLFPEAIDMLPLATQIFTAGQAEPIDQVKPVYLRDTVSWKKRKRLRT